MPLPPPPRYPPWNALIFSAGLSGPVNSDASVLTADGIDVVFGVNFVGHFALTVELMPLIQSTDAARCEIIRQTGRQAGVVGVGMFFVEGVCDDLALFLFKSGRVVSTFSGHFFF